MKKKNVYAVLFMDVYTIYTCLLQQQQKKVIIKTCLKAFFCVHGVLFLMAVISLFPIAQGC